MSLQKEQEATRQPAHSTEDDSESLSALSRLPSYRSRNTTIVSPISPSEPASQVPRPPSYATQVQVDNDQNTVASVESHDLDIPLTPRQTSRPPTYQTDISAENHLEALDTPRLSTLDIVSSPADVVPGEATSRVMDHLRQRLNDAVTITDNDEHPACTQIVASPETSPQNPFADPEPGDVVEEQLDVLQPLRRNEPRHTQHNPALQAIPENESPVQTPASRLSRTTSLASSVQTQQPPTLHTVYVPPRPIARSQTAPAPTTPQRTPSRPANDFPKQFFIRGHKIDPLVAPDQLKSHLSLLNAFWMLRKTVEEMNDPAAQPITPFPEDKEGRWTWFVGFAVERFAAWCESLSHEDMNRTLEELVPPLDVLMVWHSYLLNPGWYAEDCDRVPALRILGQIGRLVFAPSLLLTLATIVYEPITDLRRDVWNLKTQGRPFDVFEDAKENWLKLIWCPDCQEPILHPYMNPEGTGYLQQKFKTLCPNHLCYFHERYVYKSTLGARKLVEDLVRPDVDPERAHLAGTFWSTRAVGDEARAKKIKHKVLSFEGFRCPSGLADESLVPLILRRHRNNSLHNDRLTGRDDFLNEGWVLSVLWRHEFLLHSIIDTMAVGLWSAKHDKFQDTEMLSRRVFSAYSDGNIFSVDLVGAVLRQSIFMEKMHHLGWSKLDFVTADESEIILFHCVARYHGFLDLLACNHSSLHVPTLDIDLAWHTHQLFGQRYLNSCMKHVGRFVDHHDKVDENVLSNAFDETCRAWKARFNIDYISCGCPVPGKTRNQFWGLSGFRTDAAVIYEAFLKPPHLRNPTIMAGTHPSDHNAIYNNRTAEKSDECRVARLAKREKKLGESGKALNFKKGKFSERALENVHGPAFFSPIPGWYYSSETENNIGYAASMIDAQPQGEITLVHPSLKHYTDLAGVSSAYS